MAAVYAFSIFNLCIDAYRVLEWEFDDFRIFCGDFGNGVTDEVLTRAFSKYPSFLKAKVVRDKRNNKTKGYGLCQLQRLTRYHQSNARNERILLSLFGLFIGYFCHSSAEYIPLSYLSFINLDICDIRKILLRWLSRAY